MSGEACMARCRDVSSHASMDSSGIILREVLFFLSQMPSCNFGLRSSGTKNQPKEEVFGRISLRTSSQKLRSGPLNPGKESIGAPTSRADIHEKTFGLKNFGLIYRIVPFRIQSIFLVQPSGPRKSYLVDNVNSPELRTTKPLTVGVWYCKGCTWLQMRVERFAWPFSRHCPLRASFRTKRKLWTTADERLLQTISNQKFF